MGMRLTGLISGMDTESIIKQMTKTYSAKRDKVWKEKETLSYKQDAWKSLNKDVYSFFNKLSNLRLTSSYQKGETTSSNEKVASASGKVQGQHFLEVKKLATQTFLTGSRVEQTEPAGVSGALTVTVGGQEKELDITPDMSMAEIARKLTEAGLVANFDENNARLFIASKTTGQHSDFTISGDAGVLETIGLGTAATKMPGQDASISLNGADFTFDTNNFSVNGINFSIESTGSTVIGHKTNDKITEAIKSLITDYNALIKKIDHSYNNDSAKGYSPLTDEEKETLTDRQITEWEDKLKEGALSKDRTLGDLSTLLKTTMSSFSVDGMNLTSLGITLGGYFTTEKDERGVYNINDEKLEKAISADPDKVINFFSKLSSTLYDKLNEKMKSSSTNSVYTVYNDKQIKQQLLDYDKKISEWEKKITKYEDKYYSQFAKMEKVLAKSQNQANYLSNFFGI